MTDIKLMPHDLEIEKSILAGCILFENSREDALDILSPEDFYRTGHQKIFKAIQLLSKKQQQVDLQTVYTILKEKNVLDVAGGIAYISEIVDMAPVPSNTTYFCERLKNFAQIRNIIKICNTTSNQCFDSTVDAIDIINSFQREALNLDEEVKAEFTTKPELTDQSIDRYQQAPNKPKERAISTGYSMLNRILGGGFKGGKLIIIAARPGVGKTALMCNLVSNMCSKGVFCGVFSLEMSKEELDDRWIASESDVNCSNLTQDPFLSFDEWGRIMETADNHMQWNMIIDDKGGLSIDEIKRRARKMKKAGADIIFIDQLSKIGGNRRMSTFERNTEHVEEIGFLKKELGIPIVLLAQLNRKLEERTNKKPILSDLKNTGQLEEEADVVLLGYRKYVHTKDPVDVNHAEWEIAKHRQGGTMNIDFYFNDVRMRFDELKY